MLASGSRVRGFKRGRSLPSFGGEVKSSAPWPIFAACKRTSHLQWIMTCELNSFDSSFASRGLPRRLVWWRLWRWRKELHEGREHNRLYRELQCCTNPALRPLTFLSSCLSWNSYRYSSPLISVVVSLFRAIGYMVRHTFWVPSSGHNIMSMEMSAQTNYMEQRPSWDAKRCSVNKIPAFCEPECLSLHWKGPSTRPCREPGQVSMPHHPTSWISVLILSSCYT
jgi:hypothetical protein